MKATDYYNKYQERLDPLTATEVELNAAVKELFFEFGKEVEVISNTRHSKDDKVTISILREQNQKWNALCRLLEKRWGCSVILPDGFKNFWVHEMPGLKERW